MAQRGFSRGALAMGSLGGNVNGINVLPLKSRTLNIPFKDSPGCDFAFLLTRVPLLFVLVAAHFLLCPPSWGSLKCYLS